MVKKSSIIKLVGIVILSLIVLILSLALNNKSVYVNFEYKIETIRKMLKKAMEIKDEIMKNLSSYHVSISNGNSKIGEVMNVSTMPILACGNCKECKNYYYSFNC